MINGYTTFFAVYLYFHLLKKKKMHLTDEWDTMPNRA